MMHCDDGFYIPLLGSKIVSKTFRFDAARDLQPFTLFSPPKVRDGLFEINSFLSRHRKEVRSIFNFKAEMQKHDHR